MTGNVIVKAGELIEEKTAEQIELAKIDTIKIRSVLTCEATDGVCGKCYGRDLARGTAVNIGEAVRLWLPNPLGEPGTQLTMRTSILEELWPKKGRATCDSEAGQEGTDKIHVTLILLRRPKGRLAVLSRHREIPSYRAERHRG